MVLPVFRLSLVPLSSEALVWPYGWNRTRRAYRLSRPGQRGITALLHQETRLRRVLGAGESQVSFSIDHPPRRAMATAASCEIHAKLLQYRFDLRSNGRDRNESCLCNFFPRNDLL